jgi:hypothetical protein
LPFLNKKCGNVNFERSDDFRNLRVCPNYSVLSACSKPDRSEEAVTAVFIVKLDHNPQCAGGGRIEN